MEVPGKITSEDHSQSLKYGSEDDIKLYCQPCDRDGPRVQAYGYCQDCTEHLCETCYRSHRKPAPCRNHVLVDKTQMPKSQVLNQHQTADDLTEHCQRHKGRVIEYFCHDHKTLGCSPCITIGHRNCKVDFIPDISANFVRSPEYQLFFHSMKTLQDNLQQIINQTKANERELIKNKTTIKDDIQKFRQEINSMFDILESQLKGQTNDLLAVESARIHSIATTSVKMLEDIGTLQKEIKKLEDASKYNAVYIKSKASDHSVKSCTSAMLEMKEKNFAGTYVFQPDKAVKNMLRSETRIGELLLQQQTNNMSRDFNQMLLTGAIIGKGELYDNLIATPAGQIDMRMKNDKNKCCLPCIVVIKDSIAVIDSLNLAVKLVDTKQKKIVSSKIFLTRPTSLAIFSGEQLAVTLPKEQKIMFLSIPNGLSEVRCQTLEGKCCDIAFCDGKLVVSLKWPGQICFIDEQGHIQRSAEKDYFGNTFDSPMVTMDSKSKYIYVSDWSKHTVTCFNGNLKAISGFKADNLVRPRRMVTLNDGSILVCSSGNKSIYVIAPNFKESRILLGPEAGLITPWSLAVDTEQKMLFVGSGDVCDHVKMFNLKIRK